MFYNYYKKQKINYYNMHLIYVDYLMMKMILYHRNMKIYNLLINKIIYGN